MDLEQQTRIECFSNYVCKSDLGLEIGPSYRPTFSKSDKWNVVTLDHADRQNLVEKYSNLSVPIEKLNEIEEVDVVWDGSPYKELLSSYGLFDYVVAAHVIEHAVDLIGFFHDLSSILKDDGYIFLAVPDKNATFDFYRPLSTIGDVIACRINPSIYDVKAHLDEDYMRSELNGAIAWNRDASLQSLNSGNFPIPATPQSQVIESMKGYLGGAQTVGYRDAHRWVFTPENLTGLIRILRAANLIEIDVCKVEKTNYYEFLMVLKKTKKQVDLTSEFDTRMDYLMESVPYFSGEKDNNFEITHTLSFSFMRLYKKFLKTLLKK